VRLTVLGCSGSIPGPRGPCSSYLLESEGYRLLLDLGNGALGALQRHAGLDGVDATLVSHLHPDHCLDLCAWYVARRYHPEGPMPCVPVYGPAGTGARLARAYGVAAAEDMGARFDFRSVEAGRLDLGPFRLTLARVAHPVETFAVRAEADGATLTYSADTGPTDVLVDLARDTDLLLCEASVEQGRPPEPGLHLDGRQAGEHAGRAGVGRLLLTHLPPWTDPARNLDAAARAYSGAVELARPDAAYDLGRGVGKSVDRGVGTG